VLSGDRAVDYKEVTGRLTPALKAQFIEAASVHLSAALGHTRQLPSDEWTYFQYDPRGNAIAIQEPDGTTYFAYNALNLVTAIAYKTGVANYFVYDSLQRRYAMQDSQGLAYFLWDEDSLKPLTERSAADQTSRTDYTHGAASGADVGSLSAVRSVSGQQADIAYPALDDRGSVFRYTDAGGQVTHQYEYNAWGQPLRCVEEGPPGKLRYQTNWLTLVDSGGYLLLSPSRLYYARTGLFVSRDPARGTTKRHPYAYAAGAPPAQVDTTRYANDRRIRECIAECKAHCKKTYRWWKPPQRWACVSYCDNACSGQPDFFDKISLDRICASIRRSTDSDAFRCLCGILSVGDIYIPSWTGVGALVSFLDCAVCEGYNLARTACDRGLFTVTTGLSALVDAFDCLADSLGFVPGCLVGGTVGLIVGNLPGFIVGCLAGAWLAEMAVEVGAYAAEVGIRGKGMYDYDLSVVCCRFYQETLWPRL